MPGDLVVRCAGLKDGRRCTNLVDVRTDDGQPHYCQDAACRVTFQREYARRPAAKLKNLRRVHRRRYGREHRCDACTAG